DRLRAELQQGLALLGHERESASVLFGHGVDELLPVLGWQARVQGRAAVRVDVDAIALQPFGALGGALEDGHGNARAAQAVGEAEAADAPANDQYLGHESEYYLPA